MSGEASEMNFGLEVGKGFVAKMVQAVFGFGGAVLFARILGPTTFGGFYFLLTMVFIVDRPIRGLGQAVRKRFSESEADRRELMGAVILLNVGLLVLISVPVFLLGGYLVEETGVEGAPFVFVSLLAALSFFILFQRMMIALGWVSRGTWNDTLRSVLTTLFQLGFVLAGLGAAGMGYGLAVATLLTAVVPLYYLRIVPTLPGRETLGSLWAFAKFSVGQAIVGKTYDRFDVLLLGAVLTTATVGYYESAYKLTLPATFIPGLVAAGLMPRISNKLSKDLSVEQDISNAASYVSLLAVPIFFGALALSERLVVTAFGSDYRAGAPLLVGLALYRVFLSQTRVYKQVLNGFDRPDLNFKIDAITLVFNVSVGVVLVFEIGAIGVVLATAVSELLRLLASMYLVSSLVDELTYLPRPLVEQLVAGLAMFVGLEVVVQFVSLRTAVAVGLIVATGAAIYGGTLLGISRGLRRTLTSIFGDALEST